MEITVITKKKPENEFSIWSESFVNEKLDPKFIFLRVSGHSMEPDYMSGDVVLCKMIDKDVWSRKKKFLWGYVYALAVKEHGVLIKRVYESEQKNRIKAVSFNPKYKPFDIPLEEIEAVAIIKKQLRDIG